MGKPLQQSKFYQIARTIRDLNHVGSYSAATVAKEHGISVTTVNFIRRAKTWPKYQDFLTNTRAKRLAKPEKELEKALEQLELNPVDYVTAKHFNAALLAIGADVDKKLASVKTSQASDFKHLNDRLDIHGRFIDHSGKFINRVQKIKPRWFREN